MARIYISLGSNIERERNTREGVKALRESFGELELSPVRGGTVRSCDRQVDAFRLYFTRQQRIDQVSCDRRKGQL